MGCNIKHFKETLWKIGEKILERPGSLIILAATEKMHLFEVHVKSPIFLLKRSQKGCAHFPTIIKADRCGLLLKNL